MYVFLFIKVKANIRQAFTRRRLSLLRYAAYLVSHQLILEPSISARTGTNGKYIPPKILHLHHSLVTFSSFYIQINSSHKIAKFFISKLTHYLHEIRKYTNAPLEMS